MSTRIKVILLTLLFGLPTLPLGQVLWARPEITPSPQQLPFFIFLGLVESLTFGAGVAFLIVTWGFVKHAPKRFHKRYLAMYISTSWLLISWWPHDHFHAAMRMGDITYLLKIEYGFHLTLIVAGMTIAYSLHTLLRDIESDRPKHS